MDKTEVLIELRDVSKHVCNGCKTCDYDICSKCNVHQTVNKLLSELTS